MTRRQWHGPHLALVDHRNREIERLGSIEAEPVVPPMAYVAHGTYHHPLLCNTFGEAQQYLDGPGNRAPDREWNKELEV